MAAMVEVWSRSQTNRFSCVLMPAVFTAAALWAQEPSITTNGTAPADADAVASDEIPDPSGAYYDWTKTLQPERPYIHDYSQTLVMKMDVPGHLAFAQTLDVIKRLDNLTCGIPKILYLVGWEHNYTMFPDWSAVNPRLKRDEDATAGDSLRLLMAEGFKYHTTVSFHINMLDAYADSPLWNTYLQNNVSGERGAW